MNDNDHDAKNSAAVSGSPLDDLAGYLTGHQWFDNYVAPGDDHRMTFVHALHWDEAGNRPPDTWVADCSCGASLRPFRTRTEALVAHDQHAANFRVQPAGEER